MHPIARGRPVRTIGDKLFANRDEMTGILTLESGKPFRKAA
jgi:acyl-CoA reductase-like NAD-dependent aldehyde dehydrogenase